MPSQISGSGIFGLLSTICAPGRPAHDSLGLLLLRLTVLDLGPLLLDRPDQIFRRRGNGQVRAGKKESSASKSGCLTSNIHGVVPFTAVQDEGLCA
jgi:hypothetical protein